MGPHAFFIWAAYAAVALLLAALIGWLVADGRRQRRLLEQIEASSGRRRAGGGE